MRKNCWKCSASLSGEGSRVSNTTNIRYCMSCGSQQGRDRSVAAGATADVLALNLEKSRLVLEAITDIVLNDMITDADKVTAIEQWVTEPRKNIAAGFNVPVEEIERDECSAQA